ncbi:hypothetical protein QYY77_11660 [Xanthomonas campestris pv. campestris]|uniref:hypothetical protein n=1 Tax=Xanthomonas campestris TaxID=339 RepID=UPI002AD341E1|nr:hypothetical protein [Xanthomonas campestris]MEA0736730.1 hypothetical protein [Xanthomonas campestris pv. campestris]
MKDPKVQRPAMPLHDDHREVGAFDAAGSSAHHLQAGAAHGGQGIFQRGDACAMRCKHARVMRNCAQSMARQVACAVEVRKRSRSHRSCNKKDRIAGLRA